MSRFLVALWLCAAASAAAAEPRWAVLPVAAPAELETPASTFRSLLMAELARNVQDASFTAHGQVPCLDASCARAQGADFDVVVYASLQPLGQKLVTTVGAVRMRDQSVLGHERLTAERIEELDVVAERLARALVEQVPVEQTAALGSITEKESRAELRREGARGLGLGAGGFYPLSGQGDRWGMAVQLSYWFEARDFAIEPRVGLQFSVTDARSIGFPLELGAYYIFSRTDFAPFLGGGGGLRWVRHDREERQQIGTLLVIERDAEVSSDGWGPSVFVRGGVLLFRTYAMRVALSAEYATTFVDLPAQSLGAGLSVLF